MEESGLNQEMIELQKQFNKALSKIRSIANIKDCFHPNKSECILPIKSAHSLQRQGSLRILEKDDRGNKYLYIHTEREHNVQYDFLDLKKTGRKSATTFDGFCSFHDTELFKAIENEPEITDIDNDEHLFLHSYRSFAISFHRKFEQWKLYNSEDPEILELLQKIYSVRAIEELKIGVAAALNDFKKPKIQIDEWLINKKFSDLEYFALEYSYTVSVGCSAYITPHHLPSGKKIQMNPFSELQTSILTTVLPFSDRTIVILGAFPDDKLGCQFLDELESMKYEIQQQKFLSFFLFDGAENVVVSPKFIEKMTIKRRMEYCELLNFVADNRTPFLKFDTQKFPINYFDRYNAI
ncbi:hypothetical protein EI546_13160 [Aequorivita sp. H23M31]|uniref:Uncharacterized protein n=1 Tax=Aequorivita ciconiae TaxID=2494375 RepID=A0A410G5P1_9FLAO|nr:hypothetical protein [Aequorivita sp. H23M31]QAA82608.1 hypothetical protein EI546_13160 [Aequorivita sp. H23M31]